MYCIIHRVYVEVMFKCDFIRDIMKPKYYAYVWLKEM